MAIANIKRDYLTPRDLSDRWERLVSIGTLANWRAVGRGPDYVKMFSRVYYAISAVEAWEAEHLPQAAND